MVYIYGIRSKQKYVETYTYIYIVIRNILTNVTMFGGGNTGFGNNALGNPLNAGQGKGGGGAFGLGGGTNAVGGNSLFAGGQNNTFGFGGGGNTTGGFGNIGGGGLNTGAGFRMNGNTNTRLNANGVNQQAQLQARMRNNQLRKDLGLMKYQEIKDSTEKDKKYLYQEINKFQYVVEQHDTLSRDISRTYLKAHKTLLTNLEQQVYGMEQDVAFVKNEVRKHRK